MLELDLMLVLVLVLIINELRILLFWAVIVIYVARAYPIITFRDNTERALALVDRIDQ
ncbi:MAG: hypothetical protein IKE29_09565 [Paenibacillus sp.]|uniref:hypothetical protein n=1 Tax=Paenibacillus sp. TaxID=58172 RepID=UPI0025FA6014|nr:hypothetical protein [Paenibacillus sp.]MBR2564859.1 hypothetical protein [Paenibacillus sp.]